MPRPWLVLAVLAGFALTATGCADPKVGTIGGKVRVVAAENFWGSIARQLGGAHAQVQSLIVNPAQDPHSYEPTTSDARTMATAQLAIVNGVGYDPWAPKLLAANPVNGRVTLTVGQLLHLAEGDNPHRWYDPADVTRVAADDHRGSPAPRPPEHRRTSPSASPSSTPTAWPAITTSSRRSAGATRASPSAPRRASSRSRRPRWASTSSPRRAS